MLVISPISVSLNNQHCWLAANSSNVSTEKETLGDILIVLKNIFQYQQYWVPAFLYTHITIFIFQNINGGQSQSNIDTFGVFLSFIHSGDHWLSKWHVYGSFDKINARFSPDLVYRNMEISFSESTAESLRWERYFFQFLYFHHNLSDL